MQEIITKSAAETQTFAKEFATKVKPGDVITLSGELGAGKTTFVQGFAEGLGITNRIISPTFIIVRSYELHNHDANIFYHIDLYRTHTEHDMDGLGLSDMLGDSHAITVIEWPERMGSLLPKKRWDIKLETINEDTRKITYDYLSE